MTWEAKMMDRDYKNHMEGRQEERIKIARNLLKINLSLEQITTATELTYEEVENLRKET